MQSESFDWLPLIPGRMGGSLLGSSILAVRADGKGYYGRIVDITPEYVELTNGSQKQLLRFFDSPTQFAIVKGPLPHQRRLGERTLFKKDEANGTR